MKKIIFCLFLFFILVTCGKERESEKIKKSNIKILMCRALPSENCSYESKEGSPFCEIVVLVSNENKKTVHNVVVEVKIPNIFGAILLTKKVNIGTIKSNEVEQGRYSTIYDLQYMAEFQCKVL